MTREVVFQCMEIGMVEEEMTMFKIEIPRLGLVDRLSEVRLQCPRSNDSAST